MKKALKVLLVDDQAALVNSYSRLIEALGHEVVIAYDGGAAGKIFVEDPCIDAVICDIQMQPHNGIYFLQYIDRLPGKKVPVLMHSSDDRFKLPGQDHVYDLPNDIPQTFPFAIFHSKVSGGVEYIEEFLEVVSLRSS